MRVNRHTRPTFNRFIMKISMGLNIVLVLILLWNSSKRIGVTVEKAQNWHGGHPLDTKPGSCFCGADKYCMCTPSVAIDLIISSHDGEHIWLVERADTGQLATMGGFVEVGESVEEAVIREVKEEMNLSSPSIISIDDIQLFGVYSDPRRDNRRTIVSVVFVIQLPISDENIHPKAGDDAKNVRRIPIVEIEHHSFFDDHKTILMDYIQSLSSDKTEKKYNEDFVRDIRRSTCKS